MKLKYFQNMPVSIVERSVNSWKRSLTMNFIGTKNITSICQTSLLTVLNTLGTIGVLNVKKSGRAHKSDWRGNWSHEVARNLMLRYSKEKDHLLDCMIGGGTTAIEAKILNRHITCIDVNEEALERTKLTLLLMK